MDIGKDFGAGGVGLIPGYPTGADLATALRDIADDLAHLKPAAASSTSPTTVATADVAALAVGAMSDTTGNVDGLIVGDPTTPSSQITGVGNTTWNVNVSAGFEFVESVGKYLTAQVDYAVSAGSELLTLHQEIYAWIVMKNAGGTVSMAKLLGTAGAHNAAVVPTDAALDAAFGAGAWAKLALCYLYRDTDTSVVQTEDLSAMKKWGGAATAAVTELQSVQATNRALENALKVQVNLLITLCTELKTCLNGVNTAAGTIKTVKV